MAALFDKEDHAVPLVHKNGNGEFISNLSEIEKLLTAPEVRDLKVAIISVAGKYRRGKSFLLNFFLRYLYAKSNGTENNDWLGSEDTELEGFAWKLQTERLTTGILIWSKIFTLNINNEKIAIILMDTQGTFDDEHIMEEHTKIFAMTTLLSSFEIYNVMRDIEEDDLQNLALFTTHAEKFREKSDIKMGQKLQFLVRDWSYPHEFPFGFEGGKKNLAKKLDPKNRKAEFCRVREALKSSYEEISCYLMPYPGTKIITDPSSKGKISTIDEMFVKHLRKYVTYVFSAENIKPKTFNGVPIIVSDLVRLVKHYEILLAECDDNGMKMMDIFEMYAHALFDLARDKAFELYKNNMLSDSKIYETSDSFDYHHKISKKSAMDFFCKTAISGSDDIKQNYALNLEKDIKLAYSSFKTQMFEINHFEWVGKLVGAFFGAPSGACAATLAIDAAVGAGVIGLTTSGIVGAIIGVIALGATGAIVGRRFFLKTRFENLKQQFSDNWMRFTKKESTKNDKFL